MRWWKAELMCDGIYTMPHTGGKSKISTTLVIGYNLQAKNSKDKALKKAERLLMRAKVRSHFKIDKIVKIFWHTLKVKALFKKDYPQPGQLIYYIESRYERI